MPFVGNVVRKNYICTVFVREKNLRHWGRQNYWSVNLNLHAPHDCVGSVGSFSGHVRKTTAMRSHLSDKKNPKHVLSLLITFKGHCDLSISLCHWYKCVEIYFCLLEAMSWQCLSVWRCLLFLVCMQNTTLWMITSRDFVGSFFLANDDDVGENFFLSNFSPQKCKLWLCDKGPALPSSGSDSI